MPKLLWHRKGGERTDTPTRNLPRVRWQRACAQTNQRNGVCREPRIKKRLYFRRKRSPKQSFAADLFAKLHSFFGMYKSTRKKAQFVQHFVDEYYEKGRQDRCLLWVYRNKVRPTLGISERTFFRCLHIEHNLRDDDGAVQLLINFDQ